MGRNGIIDSSNIKKVFILFTHDDKYIVSVKADNQSHFSHALPSGNLLVIAYVSYFGAKLHRPKIIAMGCLLMSIGTFIIALPHFIIGR